jgi:hypothetical protein
MRPNYFSTYPFIVTYNLFKLPLSDRVFFKKVSCLCNLSSRLSIYTDVIRGFLNGTNKERCKWLAVTLLGIFVILINAHLKSLPPVILRSALELIFGLEAVNVSLEAYF